MLKRLARHRRWVCLPRSDERRSPARCPTRIFGCHCEELTPKPHRSTDKYGIYARLERWGYARKGVCHSRGKYARDEDGDGLYEVYVNTIEGVGSLLRSWLCPHRVGSQDELLYHLRLMRHL